MKRENTLAYLLAAVVFIASLYFLTSCSPRTITNSSEVKDSIHIEYVPREVVVTLPGDTVEIIKVIECDPVTNKPKPFQISKKATKAKIHLKVNSSGQLTATGSCDSLRQVITALDKEVFHLRKEKKSTVKVVEVFKTRKIDKFCRWFTIIVVVGGAIYIYMRIRGGLFSGVFKVIKGFF